jgi:predicted AAA+ superfamily ATPase
VIQREASAKVLEYASHYPVVTITGPRQSGKTTLCRMLFSDRPYVSLEAPDTREFALRDPRGFLERFDSGVVIDEVQRVPSLLSYIQVYADRHNRAGMFILTGSQNLNLLDGVAQSLAGRTALVTLLPFTLAEAYGTSPPSSVEQLLYTGFYPRVFDQRLNPSEASSFYVSTYIERDLRQLINVRDLAQFEVFLKLCAGRTGQILNMSALGNDAGIAHNTARQWLSVLEATYVIKLLRPYYRNLGKRLVKAPKLYFLDTGVAAYLLSITERRHLTAHPLRGALFESFVVSELLKQRLNEGKSDNLYFFRDNKGLEIDILLESGAGVDQLEVKSGKTISSDFFAPLRKFAELHGRVGRSSLVYGGTESMLREGVHVISWRDVGGLARGF